MPTYLIYLPPTIATYLPYLPTYFAAYLPTSILKLGALPMSLMLQLPRHLTYKINAIIT